MDNIYVGSNAKTYYYYTCLVYTCNNKSTSDNRYKKGVPATLIFMDNSYVGSNAKVNGITALLYLVILYLQYQTY